MLHTPDAVACTGLSVGYRRPALAGLDLAVAPGQTLALLGSSGSGKTTLLNTIAGFVAPLDGQVWLDGQLVRARGGWCRRNDGGSDGVRTTPYGRTCRYSTPSRTCLGPGRPRRRRAGPPRTFSSSSAWPRWPNAVPVGSRR